MKSIKYHIYPLGETAVSIELGHAINVGIHEKVMAACQLLQSQRTNWIKDIVPAYTSLNVVYDAMMVHKQNPDPSMGEYVQQWLKQVLENGCIQNKVLPRTIEIPVCYDLSFALDLNKMASQRQLEAEEVIRLHVSKTYKVYMVGFLPGFAYMGSVDEKIATPRLSTPRTNVPAGSVGIAGEQTGIYPLNSPGGWNIIGKTPLQIFDITRDNPVLLQAGDEVCFKRISLEEFNHYKPNH